MTKQNIIKWYSRKRTSLFWQTHNANCTHIENQNVGSHSALPNTQQNDTDIVGQSIIQLSSEAFRDSYKSAWRRAAKQSSLAALCCFHRTNPSAQHELHPHPVCPLPPCLQREGGGRDMLHLSFSLQPSLHGPKGSKWHKISISLN